MVLPFVERMVVERVAGLLGAKENEPLIEEVSYENSTTSRSRDRQASG